MNDPRMTGKEKRKGMVIFMGLNDTVSAERVHIGFFGLRNAGKSSVVNAVTGQDLALVSEVKGTTTDPVKKAMELLPLGPVVIVDTPGIDDEGEVGKMRVERAKQVLRYTDIAVLVVDVVKGLTAADEALISMFREKKIRYVVAFNKSDLLDSVPQSGHNKIYISAKKNKNINSPNTNNKNKSILNPYHKMKNEEK